MEKSIVDAIIANPDTTVSVLVLLGVIAGLLLLGKHLISSQKEALLAVSASMQEMAKLITELRIDNAAKGRK